MATGLRAVLIFGLLLGISAIALPVAAHGNAISADSQLSTNGTVRIERAVAVSESFVVLHAVENETPVEILGHRAVAAGAIHRDLQIRVNTSVWAAVDGNLTVRAVLHFDANGNGTFEAGTDPPIERAVGDELVASRFSIRKAAGTVHLLAYPQQTNESHAVIRRVHLSDAGYVALRRDANGTPGAVVGHRLLAAGVHRNVTVPMEEAFYENRPEQFDLWAVVHEADDDGTFELGTDRAITAAGSPVGSLFRVTRTGNLSGHGAGHEAGGEHAESATPSPSSTSTATPSPRPQPTVSPSPRSQPSISPSPHPEFTATPSPVRTSSTTGPNVRQSLTPQGPPARRTTVPSGNLGSTRSPTNAPQDVTTAGRTPGTPGFGLTTTAVAVALLLGSRS